MSDVSILNLTGRAGNLSPTPRRHGANGMADPADSLDRHHILSIFQGVTEAQQNTARQIEEVWDIIGLPQDERRMRIDLFEDRQRLLMDRILSDAYELQVQYKTKLEEKIKLYGKQIPQLEALLEHNAGGIAVPSNLTLLEQEEELRNRLNSLIALKEKRAEVRNALMSTNSDYSAALKIEPFVITDPTRRYRLDLLDELAAHNQSLEVTLNDRSSAMSALRVRIESIQKEMDIEEIEAVWDDFSHGNLLECQKLVENVRTVLELLEQKQKNVDEGEALYARIIHLCQRYGLQSELLDSAPSISANLFSGKVIDKLLGEKERLEILGRDKAEEVVRGLRSSIAKLWVSLFMTDDERDKFVGYNAGEFTEELITEHEAYLKKLGDQYDDSRRLYELLSNRRFLLQKVEQLQYINFEEVPRKGQNSKLHRDKKQ